MSTKETISATVSRKAAKIDALQAAYTLVGDDFAAVNALIPAKLTSDVNLVRDVSTYIVESGGKRLRPLLVLLTAGALEYDGDAHISLAAVIEFLHTATLLHDDVVDQSGKRRGRLTANEKWGNAPSVLVGDFLYSRAFQLMVEIGKLDIMAVLSRATNSIAEGEVLQLSNIGNLSLTESAYKEVIRCKTALLFEAATHTGALISSSPSHRNPQSVEAMRQFGMHFGMAYQLIDDSLDYAGDSKTLGKELGDDLAEGKLTLPLIHALNQETPQDKAKIEQAIQEKDNSNLEEIVDLLERTGALKYTLDAALEHTTLALNCLDKLNPNPYITALRQIATYSTQRVS